MHSIADNPPVAFGVFRSLVFFKVAHTPDQESRQAAQIALLGGMRAQVVRASAYLAPLAFTLQRGKVFRVQPVSLEREAARSQHRLNASLAMPGSSRTGRVRTLAATALRENSRGKHQRNAPIVWLGLTLAPRSLVNACAARLVNTAVTPPAAARPVKQENTRQTLDLILAKAAKSGNSASEEHQSARTA